MIFSPCIYFILLYVKPQVEDNMQINPYHEDKELTASDWKQSAFELYLSRHSHADICKQCDNLSPHTLKEWINKGEWRKQRDELEEQNKQNFVAKYRSLILSNRVDVTNRHLNISKALEKRIADKLEDNNANYDDEELLNYARALKSASDVSARAVGLSDKVDPIAEGPGIAANGMIINIGMQASPVKPVVNGEIIEE
jgi:transposase-like protein|tara:strand:+ start:4982 stop:5575 length:594 start_codon:yes stop_codon:yes gene_type:complete